MWGWIRAEGREISDKGEDDILGLVGNERQERQKYKICLHLVFKLLEDKGYGLFIRLFFQQICKQIYNIYSMPHTELGVNNITNWKAQFLILSIC